MGEGSDILTTLHYYCIGDPLTILSAFVPAAYTHYLYTFLGLLRLYLAGLSFSLLSFATRNSNKYAILAGALTYSLSYYGMAQVTGHPYFVNSMIYFPLMILGIELIITIGKPKIFIISTAIAAISNLYFFYVLALLTVCYTIVHLFFFTDYLLKDKFRYIFIIGIYALISICTAGVVFLPVMMSYIGDSRLSVNQPFHLFYPLVHYLQLPGGLISDLPSYATISVSIPVFIAVIYLVCTGRTGKTERMLKTLLIITFIFCLFPAFGRLFNVLSYSTNRWVFAFSLLCSYILTFEWENILSVNTESFNRMFLFGCILYLCLILLNRSKPTMAYAMLPLFFITLSTIRSTPPHAESLKSFISSHFPTLLGIQTKSVILLIITFICIVFFGVWHFAASFNNGQKNLLSYREVEDTVIVSESAMFSNNFINSSSSSSDMFRISGRKLTQNINILDHISSTQFYWSMSNPYTASYRTSLEMPNSEVYKYSNYDDRSVPTLLAAVKYYLTPENDSIGIPYGYEYITSENVQLSLWEKYSDIFKNINGYDITIAQLESIKNRFNNIYSIYRNNYSLPLTYCYDSYILDSTEQEISDPITRQQLQLEACFTEHIPTDISVYEGKIRDYHIPYKICCNSDEITRSDIGFTTTSYNTTADITFSASGNSETYIRFKNLHCIPTYRYYLYNNDSTIDPLNLYSKADYRILDPYTRYLLSSEKTNERYFNAATLSISAPNGANKSLTYRSPEAPYSSGRHDYTINLGYHKDPLEALTITFPSIGIYKFDDIEIYNVPMALFDEKANDLNKYHMTDVIMDTDSISGYIDVPSSKILTLATPFSKGWKAYIDDMKTTVFTVNGHYVGVEIPPGSHSVTFIYSTPYKKQGLTLSFLGVLIILVLNFYNKDKGADTAYTD